MEQKEFVQNVVCRTVSCIYMYVINGVCIRFINKSEKSTTAKPYQSYNKNLCCVESFLTAEWSRNTQAIICFHSSRSFNNVKVVYPTRTHAHAVGKMWAAMQSAVSECRLVDHLSSVNSYSSSQGTASSMETLPTQDLLDADLSEEDSEENPSQLWGRFFPLGASFTAIGMWIKYTTTTT